MSATISRDAALAASDVHPTGRLYQRLRRATAEAALPPGRTGPAVTDGDIEMLQYITTGRGRRLGLFAHHDDAEREYAYDRQSHFGRLDVALDAASVNRWTVVDMKKDWKRIFAFD